MALGRFGPDDLDAAAEDAGGQRDAALRRPAGADFCQLGREACGQVAVARIDASEAVAFAVGRQLAGPGKGEFEVEAQTSSLAR